MPEIPKPNPDLTQEQALTMILTSIALEEVALSHIMNAEAEKIQYVLNPSNLGQGYAGIKDVIAVNKSVTELLEMVLQTQMILKNKMDKVLEHLPEPPSPPDPPDPPDPPIPPIPPIPPCPPWPPNPPVPPCPPGPHGGVRSLEAIPGLYPCGEALRWKVAEGCGYPEWAEHVGAVMPLPCASTLEFDLCLCTGSWAASPGEVMLTVFCEGGKQLVERRRLNRQRDSFIWRKRIYLDIPCGCRPCGASIFICTPCGAHIQQGSVEICGL